MEKAWKYLSIEEKLERLAKITYSQELRIREMYTARKHDGYEIIEVDTSMLNDDIMLNAYNGNIVDKMN